VNGVFVPELSDTNKLPEEISIKSLHTAITEGNNIALQYFNSTLEHSKNPFALLNTAICKDGIFIHIPEKITCLTPIHLIHINCGRDKQFTNTRNLICISKNAEVTIIESYHSMNSTTKIFSNNVTEFIVEDSAKLENYILQDEGMDNYRNDVRQFSVGTNGFMNTVCVSINGGLVRNDANVLINGEHSETHLNGLFLVKENHHTDNHTMVEHRVPNCFSNELYKGIVADGSTGVFNGKILVYHDAQKTNAYQSNKNILLGDKATINTKPQLEIYADDVRCTHGTSTGKLNEEALFYLESRGLHKNLARKVLLQAFAKEVSNTIKDDAFRTFIEQKIEENIQ
jgi:Fe-S cluster assembly protein SufD